MSFYFSVQPIQDALFHRMYGKSFKKNCTIPKEELRYIEVSHYGFDGVVHVGELVANEKIAYKLVSVFRDLFSEKYPIEKICLVDDYNADDELSMADNNSSCFNFRTIDNTDQLSNHSLGMAIDINPLYNPYVRYGLGERSILPIEGKEYGNRDLPCPYYIKEGDVCFNIFLKHGFSWGGNWQHAKDYQHFEYNKK